MGKRLDDQNAAGQSGSELLTAPSKEGHGSGPAPAAPSGDERDSEMNACHFRELCEAERTSGAEVAAILFPILGWKSGGIAAAADEVSRLLVVARGEASFHRDRTVFLERENAELAGYWREAERLGLISHIKLAFAKASERKAALASRARGEKSNSEA